MRNLLQLLYRHRGGGGGNKYKVRKRYQTPCLAFVGLLFGLCSDACRQLDGRWLPLRCLAVPAKGGVHGAEERGERVWAAPENFRGGHSYPFGYNGTVHTRGTILIRS